MRRLRGIGDRPIRIVEVEAEEASPAPLDLALRTLARLMIRSYGEKGDAGAIVAPKKRSLDLTVPGSPSPHHGDEAA